MKKILSCLLVMVMVTALFIGCTGTDEKQVDSGKDNASIDPKPQDSEEQTKPKDFPSKTVEFLVPAPAGAAIDIPTRTLVDLLDLGAAKVVVNRPGASQTVGTAEYVTKPADGYTILTCAPGGLQLQPHIIDLPYTIDDFRHLTALIPPENQIIVATPSSKYQTWESLEAGLKSGEKVTWSTGNPNGIGFMAFQKLMSQVDYNPPQFVPFTGSSEGLAALLGGHIDFYVIDGTIANKKINDKQFLGLLTLDETRREDLSDVPAAGEYGFEGMDAFKGIMWISVHKDTPDDVTKWLKEQFDEAILSEAYVEQLELMGYSPVQKYTEVGLTNLVNSGYTAFGEVIESLGLGQ